MSLVLDIITVLFIAIVAMLSAQKGFVRSLVEVIGFALAIFISVEISLPISNYISNAILTTPFFARWISLPVSLIIMTSLCFVVKILAKIINQLFSFSIFGRVNKFFGGVLSVIKGALFTVAICFIIGLILNSKQEGFLIFTNEAIIASRIFKFFMGFTPFL